MYSRFNLKTVLNHQMWDMLIKVECSVEGVSSSWKLGVKKDLQKRISEVRICALIIGPGLDPF